MQKIAFLVIIVVGLVGAGIGLSIYGNQILFEDLVKGEGMINTTNDLKISSEINRESSMGIYAIEIINFREGITVTARVLDPYNSQIEFEEISVQRFEEKFEITDDGVYNLLLENNSDEEIQIVGVIGPEPDPGKQSIGFISLYLLVVGLIGMSVVAVYAIKNKSR